jgi:hypothetical protein
MASLADQFGGVMRLAFKFAAVYSVWTIIATLLSRGRNLEYLGRPLLVVILVYFVLGAVIGVLVGFLKSFATSRFRAGILGFLIGLPTSLGINLVFRPQLPIRAILIGTFLSALFLGTGYGLILWEPPVQSVPRTQGRNK